MADRRNRVSIECEWSKNTGVIRQPRGRISSNFFCEYTHKATWNRLVEIHTELSYSTFHLLPFQIVSRRWPFLRISNSLSERRRLIESGSKKDRRFKNTRRREGFRFEKLAPLAKSRTLLFGWRGGIKISRKTRRDHLSHIYYGDVVEILEEYGDVPAGNISILMPFRMYSRATRILKNATTASVLS